eukprot:TRINITY_DN7630_c0_g1_i6.p3 TRINITY_DN7630_c0_g1~~TRINITY_DN7630_c0_g1_i6.p3  ORF type:complete len:158 (-),score=37.09 TRINITY_DN7630_c0_g1_i6:351-824(-)
MGCIDQFYLIEKLADKEASLVEWWLGSGRKHQIRVHAAYTGFPLFGDDRYGEYWKGVKKMSKGRKQRRKSILEALDLLHRPALHAQFLQFEHPTRQEIVTFRKEPPDDFLAAIDILRSIDVGSENKEKYMEQEDVEEEQEEETEEQGEKDNQSVHVG